VRNEEECVCSVCL